MICTKYEKILSLDSFTPECKGKISQYICPLCEGVYIDPVIEGCGHIFCSKCIKQHLEHFSDCPQCGHKIDFSNFHSIKFVEDTIEKQSIYCKNKLNDCKWIGKYYLLENHVKICPKQIIKCQNDQCGFSVKREEFATHSCPFELIECQICHLMIQRNIIDKHHSDAKEMTEISISLRDNAENLDKDSIIECVFSKFGCQTSINKSQLSSHNQEFSDYHNQIIINFILDFQSSILTRLCSLEDNFRNFTKIHNFPLNITNKTIPSPSQEVINNDIVHINSNFDIKLTNKKRLLKTSTLLNINENSKEDIKNSIFDLKNLSKGIIFNNNIAQYTTKLKNQHAFMFLNIELNKKQSWKIKINKISYWIAIGVCEKNSVIQNNYMFRNNCDLQFNHNCFLLSSNSYIWNCKNEIQNNKNISSLPNFKENDEINVTYYIDGMQLNFTYSKYSFTLNNVYPKDALVPCAIMLSHGDELSFELM